MQTLATFTAAASGSEPPAPSVFETLQTPTTIPQLQLAFIGLSFPSAPSSAVMDVWGTDGNGNVYLLAAIDLALTGNQPSVIIDCYTNRICLVPVLSGGSSPTITCTVIGQPIQLSVQLSP